MGDRYKVVINHEEQYSVLPVDQSTPRGWSEVGRVGSHRDCIDYIEEVWTDNRPADLRKAVSDLERRLRIG